MIFWGMFLLSALIGLNRWCDHLPPVIGKYPLYKLFSIPEPVTAPESDDDKPVSVPLNKRNKIFPRFFRPTGFYTAYSGNFTKQLKLRWRIQMYRRLNLAVQRAVRKSGHAI